uniref:MyTH4 domain-containing protein n=1 Tax=Petromyzon marinus TaxID=7757 RepID=S4RVD6_PETMA
PHMCLLFHLPKPCENQPEMRDEIYCHIVKQITSNKSPKPDSCHRGWRLLYIVTAYSKCSDNLKPYLLRYLREVANDSKASFQGMARVCEQHLRRTLQVGGRTQLPSSMELKALVAGRNSKRQLILLPGAIERHVKIKTNSSAMDVIEEICQEMGLHRQEAQEEFAIFLVTNRGESVRPLQKKEYILDVSSEAEKVDEMHRFWFRRIVWVRPLKFDNELYISMHFNQILPEYMNGLFLVLTAGRIDDQLTQQVAKLAALQHRIKGSDYQPTQREVGEYIPAQVLRMQRPQSWLGVVLQHSAQVQALSAHQARAQFMGVRISACESELPCLWNLSKHIQQTPWCSFDCAVEKKVRDFTPLPMRCGNARPRVPYPAGGAGELPHAGGAVDAHAASHTGRDHPLRGDHAGQPHVATHHAAAAAAGT